MIQKPCFHLSDYDDGWNDDRIHECGPMPRCTRDGKKLYWSTCNSGKRHPFYANWQRMLETPAAGPCLWNWDTDGFWNTACGKAFYFDDGGQPNEDGFTFCPYCGAKINTEVSK